jgi:hypothetical protein
MSRMASKKQEELVSNHNIASKISLHLLGI